MFVFRVCGNDIVPPGKFVNKDFPTVVRRDRTHCRLLYNNASKYNAQNTAASTEDPYQDRAPPSSFDSFFPLRQAIRLRRKHCAIAVQVHSEPRQYAKGESRTLKAGA